MTGNEIVLSPENIFSLVILFIASVIFYKAIKQAWLRWRFINHCEVTRAQVIQKSLKALSGESSLLDKKSLRYINNMGKVVTFQTRWLGKGEKGQELHSDGVEVIYDPDHPEDIRLNNAFLIWFKPMFWLAVTFIIFMSAFHNSINSGAWNEVVRPLLNYASLLSNNYSV